MRAVSVENDQMQTFSNMPLDGSSICDDLTVFLAVGWLQRSTLHNGISAKVAHRCTLFRANPTD
jgi:hypothetical protein